MFLSKVSSYISFNCKWFCAKWTFKSFTIETFFSGLSTNVGFVSTDDVGFVSSDDVSFVSSDGVSFVSSDNVGFMSGRKKDVSSLPSWFDSVSGSAGVTSATSICDAYIHHMITLRSYLLYFVGELINAWHFLLPESLSKKSELSEHIHVMIHATTPQTFEYVCKG